MIVSHDRSVAQFGRAAVSKTACRGFESFHSCQIAEVVEWKTRYLEGVVGASL